MPAHDSVLLFDLESHPLDHFPGGVRGQARSRQVAVDKDRIDRVQRVTLQVAQIEFASAGGADLGAGVEQAEQANRLEASLGRQVALVLPAACP